MTDPDFDWSDTDQIAVREQLATAVYVNVAGDVVVRQTHWPDDDVCIVVSPTHVPKLVDAILEAANLPGGAHAPIHKVPK